MRRPIITLLTDFGYRDHYVGAMKGVILGICPDAQLVDISHEIAPWSIEEATFTLSQAWTCFPAGTVHLIVIDPGVGSSRRPLIAGAAGHFFVAPDNGVLTMVYDAVPAHEVREITETRYLRQPVSQTFHGRDIFAPVAARLATGLAPAEFGGLISDHQRLGFGKPVQTGPATWTGTVLKIDRFGNLITNLDSGTWSGLAGQSFEMRIAGHCVSRMACNYAEMQPGELCVIAGSAGLLEVSLNRGNAAASTGARSGDTLELRVL
jgi:S-adenosylmethionine hydrolase